MAQSDIGVRRQRGRPRKFAAPSRHVTVTLPEQVIDLLTGIDADLSRAIVRVVEGQRPRRPRIAAELSRFGSRAVIVVNPSPTRARRAGVDLVPLPDGRALIAFDRARTTADFELTVSDALEDAALSAADRTVFEAIAAILKSARHSDDVVLRQRNIIVLEAQRRHRAPRAGSSRQTPKAGRTRRT